MFASSFTFTLESSKDGLPLQSLNYPPPSSPPFSSPQLLTIDDDFCGLDMNAPLGVSEMVRGKPLYSDASDKMTSVIAYVYKNHSLVFVGTKNGRVKKVREAAP